jgi:hypothetical protein
LKGVFFREWLLFKKRVPLGIGLILLSVFFGLFLALSSIIQKQDNGKVFIESNFASDIPKYLENNNISTTSDINEASLLLQIKTKDGQQVITLKKAGNSPDKTVLTTGMVKDKLNKYKNETVKANIKTLNVNPSVFDPIIIQETEQEMANNKKISSMLEFFPMIGSLFSFFLMVVFQTGYLEERKSLSIYSVTLSGIAPWKALFAAFSFRVALVLLVPLTLATVGVGFYFNSFLQSFLVVFPLYLMVCFTYLMVLLFSLHTKSAGGLQFTSMALMFIPAGYSFIKNSSIRYNPFSYGSYGSEQALYGLYSHSLLSIFVYFTLIACSIFLGAKLMQRERLYQCEVS